MQRSITHKTSLAPLGYVALFILYESLGSIYLFLPPFFGVLFVLFVYALDKEDAMSAFAISLCLVIFEADRGYILLTSILYFILIYKFVMPKIIQNVNCKPCIKVSYVLFAYVGFFIFNALLSKIFMMPMPVFTYYIIYYIVIEFLIVSIL